MQALVPAKKFNDATTRMAWRTKNRHVQFLEFRLQELDNDFQFLDRGSG
jgi:hypothetical protein